MAAFLTAFYMGRVIVIALLGPPSEHAAHAHEAGPAMTAALLLLALPAIALGYFGASLTGLYGAPVHLQLSGIGAAASVLALAGLGGAYWLFGAPARGARVLALIAPLGRWARSNVVDDLWLIGYRLLLSGVAQLLALVDLYLVDGVMNLIGWLSLEGGKRLRPLQTGNVQDYVYVLIIATMALGTAAVVMQ